MVMGGKIEEMKNRNTRFKLPPIGMRMIKSALVVYACLLVDMARGNTGIPFYAAIAGILCIQPYREEAKKAGWGRICGTFIGAFWGVIALFINLSLPEGYIHLQYVIIALMVIPTIYTTNLFRKNASTFIACIALLSVDLNHIGDANPYLFAFNRVLDTSIGVGVALIINSIELPKRYNKDILFVMNGEKAFGQKDVSMSGYSLFFLNHMLDAGAKLTFATYDTPAAAIQMLSDIHINLPVVVLDGAALYDMKANTFLKKYEMSYETALEVKSFAESEGEHCFSTVIEENAVVTYIGEFRNEMEQLIYEKDKASPYQNYLRGNLQEGKGVVYLMIVDTAEQIGKLQDKMKTQPFYQKIRISCEHTEEDSAYMHMKIYSSNASVENMLDYIKANYGIEKTKTFGIENFTQDSQEQREERGDDMIKQIKRCFQPYIWQKDIC